MNLLERVRACLLNARLAGSFYVRREGDAIRLDLRWRTYATLIVDALKAGGFTYVKTEERGVILISEAAKDGA